MTERWDDRDISPDTGILLEKLDEIVEQLKRIADVVAVLGTPQMVVQPPPKPKRRWARQRGEAA